MKLLSIGLFILTVLGCKNSFQGQGNIKIQSGELKELLQDFISEIPESQTSRDERFITVGFKTAGLDTPVVSMRNCLPSNCNSVKGFTIVREHKVYFQGAFDQIKSLVLINEGFECEEEDYYNGRVKNSPLPPKGINCPERFYYYHQSRFILL